MLTLVVDIDDHYDNDDDDVDLKGIGIGEQSLIWISIGRGDDKGDQSPEAKEIESKTKERFF